MCAHQRLDAHAVGLPIQQQYESMLCPLLSDGHQFSQSAEVLSVHSISFLLETTEKTQQTNRDSKWDAYTWDYMLACGQALIIILPCIVCIHSSGKPKSPLEPGIYSNISYTWDVVFALLPFMQPALLFFRQIEQTLRYRNNPKVSAGNNNDDLTETIHINSVNL